MRAFLLFITFLFISNSYCSNNFLEPLLDNESSNTEIEYESLDDYLNRVVNYSKNSYFSLVPEDLAESNYKQKSFNYKNALIKGTTIVFKYSDDFVIFKNQCLEVANELSLLNLKLNFDNHILTNDLNKEILECINIMNRNVNYLSFSHGAMSNDIITSILSISNIKSYFGILRITGINFDKLKPLLATLVNNNNINLSLDVTNIVSTSNEVNYFSQTIKANKKLNKLYININESNLDFSFISDILWNTAQNTELEYLLLNTNEKNLKSVDIETIYNSVSKLYNERRGKRILIFLPKILSNTNVNKLIQDSKASNKNKLVDIEFN